MQHFKRFAFLFSAFCYACIAIWMLYASGSNFWLFLDDLDLDYAMSGAISFCCFIACGITSAWMYVGGDA